MVAQEISEPNNTMAKKRKSSGKGHLLHEDIQNEVFLLEKEIILAQIENLKLDKDRIIMETEKIALEKEKIKLEKEEISLDILKFQETNMCVVD